MTVTNQPAGRRGKRSAVAPAATRLPSTRERRPALAALAVLLIAGGAVLAGWLALREGQTSSYLVIDDEVRVGQAITSGDLGSIELQTSSGGAFVLSERRDEVVGSFAQADLLPGSPVIPAMFGAEPALRDGTSRIGLSLAPGRYPPSLAIGNSVTIVLLDPNGSSESGAGTATGVVRDMEGAGTGQGIIVDVVVSEQCNTVLTAGAANGDVAINTVATGTTELSCSPELLADTGGGSGG